MSGSAQAGGKYLNVFGMGRGFSLQTEPWNRRGSIEGRAMGPEHWELEGEGYDLGAEKATLGGFKSGCGKTVIMSKSILVEPLGTNS